LTTINDVYNELLKMEDELAKEWLHNDIVKFKIATTYDDWMEDVHDHNLPLSLQEHIEVCMDTPELIDYKKEHSD
jgi:hypothetical protein